MTASQGVNRTFRSLSRASDDPVPGQAPSVAAQEGRTPQTSSKRAVDHSRPDGFRSIFRDLRLVEGFDRRPFPSGGGYLWVARLAVNCLARIISRNGEMPQAAASPRRFRARIFQRRTIGEHVRVRVKHVRMRVKGAPPTTSTACTGSPARSEG